MRPFVLKMGGSATACLIAGMLLAPAAPAGPLPKDMRLVYERAGWKTGAEGEGEIQQSVIGLSALYEWSRRVETEVEIDQVRAARSGARLGSFVRGGLLVRVTPLPGWLVQAGIGTPSGGGELSKPLRSLATLLGDPLFSFPVADPVRGWRFHAGALHATALSRSTRVLTGIAGDWNPSFEPGMGGSLDPADRLLASLSLLSGGERMQGEARLTCGLEGSERLEGESLREGGTLLGVAGRIAVRGLGADASASVEGVGCPQVSVLDLDTLGALREAGPGLLARVGFQIDRASAFPLGGSVSARPGIGLVWTRVMPDGLPMGDGWTAQLSPRFELQTEAGDFEVGGAFARGSWRPYDAGAYRPSETLRGWTFRLSWSGARILTANGEGR